METEQEQEARIKRLLKPENYDLFFDYYFGINAPIPMADSRSAKYHVDIYKDLYYNPFITLFNCVFRGGAKSTHANMGYPLALKQSKLARFFLTVGINEDRAIMLLQDIQAQLEANNRIIKDFGVQKTYGSWADAQFETNDKCTFMALGLNQPMRGLRANGVRLEYVSIDDCEDLKTALNPNLIQEYADKITGDIQGAFSIQSERTIINNNLITNTGLVAKVMKKKGFDPKAIDTKRNNVISNKYAKIHIVNLTDKFYDKVSEENMADWEPSWKERYSKEACLRKIEQYKTDPAILSGEFYNTPIKVGKRIKESMIKMVKPKPFSSYIVIVGNWDFAYSDSACFKALATLGVSELGLTCIDVFCRQQADINAALDYHYTQANKIIRLNQSTIFFYDASVSQECIYEKQVYNAALKHKSIVIPLPQKSHTDKFTKIDTVVVGTLLSGMLNFSEDLLHNPDWEEAKNQMLNFEKGGKYFIDFPDTLADAILQAQEYLNFSSSNEDNKPIIKPKKRGGY
ncbi:MAG: hypothetical protein ACK5MH_00545 [Bacteroidales bacterium]